MKQYCYNKIQMYVNQLFNIKIDLHIKQNNTFLSNYDLKTLINPYD